MGAASARDARARGGGGGAVRSRAFLRASAARAIDYDDRSLPRSLPMKLAFSTNAFTRFPLFDAVNAIKDAGFEGVEILADVPHAYPETIDTAFTINVRKMLDRAGLAVSSINANCSFGYWKDAPPEPYFELSLISPNRQHRDDRSRLIMKTIDFARDI